MKRKLRSQRWFGPSDLRSFGHRSRAMQMGWDRADWEGRPVIGILNTWSDLNPCHMHFKIAVEQVKRGVLQAGGLPVELPVMSVGETFTKPTSMLYRNFLAMECEETLRCNPIDGAVLLGGCDKTVPALLMGAFSMNLPSIVVPAGPMLRGNWRGETLGSGSDAWKYWDEKRAGNLTEDAWREVEEGIARSHGHCMTMGTASTMTAVAETLGFTLPGASSTPAVDAGFARMATQVGRQIVENVWSDLKPSRILTENSFHNAIAVDMAIGGSTNAIVHLLAMASRAGMPLTLQEFDSISKSTPLLLDLRPTGRFLMEDFYYAGGLPALLNTMGSLLHRESLTITGKTLGENVAAAAIHNPEVIRSLEDPLAGSGGTAVLQGNLAPDGAVIKHASASKDLLNHEGHAIVFDDYEELLQRLDDPELKADADSVLVLRNAGPVGGPGMPEWGMLPLPKKLLEAGVRDMVRLSDARMSGTSYGTCVLHVAPESAVGGPLGLVEDGDLIRLDVDAREISLFVKDDELSRRRNNWRAPKPKYARGYGKLFLEEVTQANEGCDFRFLRHGPDTPEPSIH